MHNLNSVYKVVVEEILFELDGYLYEHQIGDDCLYTFDLGYMDMTMSDEEVLEMASDVLARSYDPQTNVYEIICELIQDKKDFIDSEGV